MGDEYIDAEGAYVIPGGIDPHTHLEMPFMGTTAAETFETGTWAAAVGGTTMIVDFCLRGQLRLYTLFHKSLFHTLLLLLHNILYNLMSNFRIRISAGKYYLNF